MSATGPGASPAPSEPRRNTQAGAEGRHRHVHDERVHAGDALRRPARPLRSVEVDVLITRLPVDEPDLTVGPVVLSPGSRRAARPSPGARTWPPSRSCWR